MQNTAKNIIKNYVNGAATNGNRRVVFGSTRILSIDILLLGITNIIISVNVIIITVLGLNILS
jgi:hypothetical protein